MTVASFQIIFTFRFLPETIVSAAAGQPQVGKECTVQLNKRSCLHQEIDFSPKQPAAFSHTAGTPRINTHIVFEAVCVYTGRHLNDNNNKKCKNATYRSPRSRYPRQKRSPRPARAGAAYRTAKADFPTACCRAPYQPGRASLGRATLTSFKGRPD